MPPRAIRSVVIACAVPVVLAGQDSTVARSPVRVCAGGDVTLGTNLDVAWAASAARRMRTEFGLADEPEALVAPLRPLFADADIVLVNAEMAIGSGRTRRKCAGQRDCYAFRSPPGAADALRSLGANGARVVANVANNHSHDAGNEGLAMTEAHLQRAGVLPTGLDTLATLVELPGRDTVAFLGFYTGSDTPDARDLAAVRRHVARAAAAYGAVVVTAHIGAEGVREQRTRDRTEYFLRARIDRGNPVAFARAALDGGAVLVVNHGPHVLRAAEWAGDQGDRLVLYSLGNLVTYGPFNVLEPLNRGVVACVDLARGRVVRAELRATVQRAAGVVAADLSGRALTLIDSLSALDFPVTGVRVTPAGDLVKRP